MNGPENNPPVRRRCAECGAELPASISPDLCPKCLLKQAMATEGIPPGETAIQPGARAHPGGMPALGGPFGHYFVVRPLGGGGMGAVFEAQDLESGRRVALKVLSQSLDSPDARERFLREGRLAASINHPNSVYVFGTEEIAGTPVIAMELVAGGTLEEQVRSQGPMPVGKAVDAMLQVIGGLEAAQRIGILHRDIKPSNCFIDADGTIKIGDFGLSISTALRTEPALTATGAFLGTPAFCSPEQLRGEELNARSDMYSVGATLFYLLTGRTAFEAKNVVALLAMVFEQRAPSVRQVNPRVPEGLARVIQRCLEKQPGERFKSYAELAQALAPYSSSAPVPASLPTRFLAGLVDLISIGCFGLSVLVLAGLDPMRLLNLATQESWRWLLLVAAGVVVSMVYYAVLEGRWGATLGKAICRLRVIGPDKNVPGLPRALLRALIYVVVPMVPMWVVIGFNPREFLAGSTLIQYLANALFYLTLAVLFCTARKRNGYAALQDLASGTRVVNRVALQARPVPSTNEASPGSVEKQPRVGPYYVLETIQEMPGGSWLLGYDLRLLRKVWLRTQPPGTPPVPGPLRNLGRIGRLRWLTGRRSPEENWDAFEAVSGKPLVALLREPQPWEQVRYWLHDLATEMSAAYRDNTLPTVLGLDRVWISGEGRAKLLDFPAPGLQVAAEMSPPVPPVVPDQNACVQFLAQVSSAALGGSATKRELPPAGLPLRLPLHARAFFKTLSRGLDLNALLEALRPLLQKPAVVTRSRRAVILAGCLALPVMGMAFAGFGLGLVREWERRDPGLFQLMILTEDRWARHTFNPKAPGPSDQDLSVYIASHYRSLITNEPKWSSALALSLVKGEGRRFAEESVRKYPAPRPEEVAQAEKAVAPLVKTTTMPDIRKEPLMVLVVLLGSLAIYIGVPAVLAAVLFRGGLVLLATGVTFVRRDGLRASRLRVLWRSLVAWALVWPAFVITAEGLDQHRHWLCVTEVVALAALALLSVLLPRRGLPDRLAGTWPVPR